MPRPVSSCIGEQQPHMQHASLHSLPPRFSPPRHLPCCGATPTNSNSSPPRRLANTLMTCSPRFKPPRSTPVHPWPPHTHRTNCSLARACICIFTEVRQVVLPCAERCCLCCFTAPLAYTAAYIQVQRHAPPLFSHAHSVRVAVSLCSPCVSPANLPTMLVGSAHAACTLRRSRCTAVETMLRRAPFSPNHLVPLLFPTSAAAPSSALPHTAALCSCFSSPACGPPPLTLSWKALPVRPCVSSWVCVLANDMDRVCRDAKRMRCKALWYAACLPAASHTAPLHTTKAMRRPAYHAIHLRRLFSRLPH
mmetsp:Transcript_19/g.48  ORF Transcript_19/g.48 Transcript_19/m.48 type:complete len:307 (-) Transcript_19:101-1021(-)